MKKLLIYLIALLGFSFLGCSTAPLLTSQANLENTYWKLTVLNNIPVLKTKTNRREAHIVLSNGGLKGNSGCNGMGGTYKLDRDKISFSDKGFMSTRMFCNGSVEPEFLKTIKNIETYKLEGEYLEFFDKKGLVIMRFESVYLY